MSVKYAIKAQLRHVANNSLGRLHYRRSAGKGNIMLFSNRRGGSTWLIELLSAEPNTKRSVEIFDVTLNHNPYRSRLPDDQNGFFVDLSTAEQEQLFDYYQAIESGQIVYNTQWKFWQQPYNFVYDRHIFKLFYVKNYIAEFERRFPGHIIFQMRHPVATAMSIERLGWPNCAKPYVNSKQVGQLLTPEQHQVANAVLEKGTSLEQHVLGWFLENWIPITLAPTSSWLVLQYETMVREPLQTASLLSSRLQLTGSEQFLNNYRKPSYNAFDSQQKIERYDVEQLCEGWRDKLDIHKHALIADIFQAFSNPYYSWDL
ncbi:hypothetical protein QWY77_06540 [Thalassotalea ponticola]|uniref:hypothetical protein n=1 Tax=Thalassotalea ponticola TaxID=1523392 RepID=UPI0025B40DF6|nr:hypothetical protein [Thalassotalea ponticola]MDN3652420.1 hypothetical protein [Thalassotalea ponticola]